MLLAQDDDQKNSYAVCFFNEASGDPSVVDVFTQEWDFETDNILWTSPAQLNVLAPYGNSAPLEREVTLSNYSNSAGLTWTATGDPSAPWLSLEQSNGQTPGTMQMTIDASGLVTGTYEAEVQLTTVPGSLNAPMSLPVVLHIGVHQVYLPLIAKH